MNTAPLGVLRQRRQGFRTTTTRQGRVPIYCGTPWTPCAPAIYCAGGSAFSFVHASRPRLRRSPFARANQQEQRQVDVLPQCAGACSTCIALHRGRGRTCQSGRRVEESAPAQPFVSVGTLAQEEPCSRPVPLSRAGPKPQARSLPRRARRLSRKEKIEGSAGRY